MTENNYDKLKDAICELVNIAEDATSREVFEILDNAGVDVYFTECGQAHIFVDGKPEENNYEYCPYCGKKIKVVW